VKDGTCSANSTRSAIPRQDPCRPSAHQRQRHAALKWSSTKVYTEDAAGAPVNDWTRLDAIMDELTKPGIEPFVQASVMPQALSSKLEPYTPTLVKTGLPRDMVSGCAFYPPKDYTKWEALIEAWVRHSGERYGKERASSWLWVPFLIEG
jgi:xylan 1,4-beta-xylosidase